MERIVEICCGSFEDAYNVYKAKGKRIELNSALYMGGLTCSVASLMMCKKHTPLEVICMVRPRGAGFCYSQYEIDQMMLEATTLLEKGADGIAFGFLNEDHTIDVNNTKKMIDLIRSYGKQAVFHRAFDCVNDPYQAIETLISLGTDRILTSGLKAKAIDGLALIKDLQDKYGDKIQILAGSGVNSSNAKEIMDKTGIYQVHSSCKDWLNDMTTKGDSVSYSYDIDHEYGYDVVSKQKVKDILDSVKF